MSAEITVTFDLVDDGMEDERRRLVEEIARLQAQLDAIPEGDDPGLVRASLAATIEGLKRRLSAISAFDFDDEELEAMDVEDLDDLIAELDSAINAETDFRTQQYLMSLLTRAKAARTKKGRQQAAQIRNTLKLEILRTGGDVGSYYPAGKGSN